eukprot:COSAG06_NODE_19858_length_819_cov_1.798611_1_plen_180_part_00
MANAKNERSLGFASLTAVGYWCLPHCRVPIINAVAGLGISCRSFAITQRVLELNIRGRSSGVAATRHVVCTSPSRSLRTSAARPRDATRARTPRGPARRKYPPARHVVRAQSSAELAAQMALGSAHAHSWRRADGRCGSRSWFRHEGEVKLYQFTSENSRHTHTHTHTHTLRPESCFRL